MGLVRMSQTTARRFAGAMRLGDSRPHGFRGIAPLSPHPVRSDRLQVVKVAKDGGVEGSASTNCTWTYTISTLSGAELATGLTPHKSRYGNTIYTQAPDDSYGLAQNIGNAWVLLVAWQEIQNTGDCT